MKKQSKAIVTTDLTIEQYIPLVKAMADGYFTDGEYTPHIGRVNSMCLFYNYCVTGYETDGIPALIENVKDVDKVFIDPWIQKEYQSAKEDAYSGRLNFACACLDAHHIVESRLTVAGAARAFLKEITDKLNDTFSVENLDAVKKIGKALEDNHISADVLAEAMVNAYGQSQRFHDVIHGDIEPVKK